MVIDALTQNWTLNMQRCTSLTQQDTDIELNLDLGNMPLSRAIAQLEEACTQLEDRSGAAALLLRIQGSGMTAGDPAHRMKTLTQWERTLRRLEGLPAATVAILEGDCFYAAFELVLATDFRFAPPQVRIGLSSDDLVVWPGMALYRLACQLGAGRARQLILFGIDIAADQAHTMGIIDRVTVDAEKSALDFVHTLPPRGRRDMALRRRLLLEAPSVSYDEALGSHLAACDRATRWIQQSPLAA
jgi:isomerase DpgB